MELEDRGRSFAPLQNLVVLSPEPCLPPCDADAALLSEQGRRFLRSVTQSSILICSFYLNLTSSLPWRLP